MIVFPFGTDRRQRRFPWMNVAIIVVNVLVFITVQSQRPTGGAMGPGASAGWYGYMLDPNQPALVQFITYQFLHAGLSHIGFNMLFLYVFGNSLNEKLGHVGYLAFYLAGGVLAGIGHVLTSDAMTLGASGSVSAVTGLFLALLPRIHIKLFIWLFIFMDIWEIPSMYFILFKFGQDVFEHLMGSAGVAYMAHISGTAAGLGIGLLLLWTKLVQRDHYDLMAMVNRYRRRAEYRTIVARGYDPFNPVPGTQVENSGVEGAVPRRPVDPRTESLRGEISRLLRMHDLQGAAQHYLALRAIDGGAVLPAQEQLDVGNQLMSEGRHAEAAGAYDDYLRVYPSLGAGQQDQIALMLGLIYARYLSKPEKARECLEQVLPRLSNARERELAESELRELARGARGEGR